VEPDKGERGKKERKLSSGVSLADEGCAQLMPVKNLPCTYIWIEEILLRMKQKSVKIKLRHHSIKKVVFFRKKHYATKLEMRAFIIRTFRANHVIMAVDIRKKSCSPASITPWTEIPGVREKAQHFDYQWSKVIKAGLRGEKSSTSEIGGRGPIR